MKRVLQIAFLFLTVAVWVVAIFNYGRDYGREEASAYVDQFIVEADRALKDCRPELQASGRKILTDRQSYEQHRRTS